MRWEWDSGCVVCRRLSCSACPWPAIQYLPLPLFLDAPEYSFIWFPKWLSELEWLQVPAVRGQNSCYVMKWLALTPTKQWEVFIRLLVGGILFCILFLSMLAVPSTTSRWETRGCCAVLFLHVHPGRAETCEWSWEPLSPRSNLQVSWCWHTPESL